MDPVGCGHGESGLTSRGCGLCYEEELLSEPVTSRNGHPGHGTFENVRNEHGHLSVRFVPCTRPCCNRNKGG